MTVDYWDKNLDVGNLGREEASFDLAREKAFWLATPELRFALRELAPDPSKRILDLGAGLGVASVILAERGAESIALDSAPNRVEALRKLSGTPGKITPIVGTAESLPLDDASVDAVFTRSVLIHTKLPEALAEIRRVLKPGGRAVFVEPMTGNPLVNLYRRFLAPPEWKDITTYWTTESVGVVGTALNPSRIRAEYFHLWGFLSYGFQFAIPSPAWYRFSMAISDTVDRCHLGCFPSLRHLAWFVVVVAEMPKK